MGLLAWIFGALGGLCAVVGIITVAEVIPTLGSEFTWVFWFGLAGILLLACIAAAIGGGAHE